MSEETPAPPPSAESNAAAPKGKKPKAQRVLPTERVAFPKQMEVLRAYGQLGLNGKPVPSGEVAKVLALHPNTISLANGFFTDVGFLTRGGDGQIPCADVLSYARAYEWDKDTAAFKLGTFVGGTWFGQALLPKVRFRPHTRHDALGILAEAAGASIEHRSQVESLLELLAFAGLIQFDGEMVKARAVEDAPKEEVGKKIEAPPPGVQAPATPAAGAFQFTMSVTMADIAALPAEKIAAFMTAIAELMKIKAEADKARNGGAT